MAIDLNQVYILKCPHCGNKNALSMLTIQDEQELACPFCNGLFRVGLSGRAPTLSKVRAPTGSQLGPAEGPLKGRQ